MMFAWKFLEACDKVAGGIISSLQAHFIQTPLQLQETIIFFMTLISQKLVIIKMYNLFTVPTDLYLQCTLS